LYPRKIINLI